MKEIEYNVYRGVYPFDELLGTLYGSADDPVEVLWRAILYVKDRDIHPVVAPA